MNPRNKVLSFFIAGAVPTLISQPAWAQGIAVTNVQLQRTDSGIELILQTPTGKQPETFRTSYGETLIIDLINTQLSGEGFQEDNPAPGIASVEVVQRYANTVRVKLVGTEEVPTAQVNTTPQGIALNVSTEMTAAQEPAPAPTPETTLTPQQPEAGQQEPIELVVTATRTEERQEDVARSVTVIDREEIEQQATLTENLGDILGKLVPGFGPPQLSNLTNAQTLRGRQPQILVDGVPLRTNSANNIQLRFIAPSSIERIEVVRGPTAIFGGEGQGGVINIITREPTEEPFEATTEIGLGAALGGLEGDSFRNQQQQTISFNQGDFDFTFIFSRNDTNSFFDAEGDRIARGNATLDKTETLNLNSKLGVDLSEEQRLQLTFNYTRDQRTLDSVTEISSGKAIGVEREFEFEGDLEPNISNTIANLSYTHEDLLGSEVQAQLFYRDSSNLSTPFDARPNPFNGLSVLNNGGGSEVWGGRVQADASLGNNFDLLLGVDYEQQDVDEGFFGELSPSAFDRGVIRKVGERTNTPPYELNKLGLFTQLQWEASNWLRLSGGIRHERFDLAVDDFDAIFSGAVEGGEVNLGDTVFIIGAVVAPSQNVNIFAKFSQGFSAPSFADIFQGAPEGLSVDEGLEEVQPVVVDEYEIGVRGNWESLQATVSAFYNFSELGSTIDFGEVGEGNRLIRSPKRVYGLEATVDWQPADKWQLGGTLSWNEGGIDPNNDDDFEPLDSFEIQPLKMTAYLENQTTPGWNNRLQLLFVGGRDRAFEEGVDNTEIESYAVLDYISSVDIGPGTLEIGIQNLLDNQYFPVFRQLVGANNPSLRSAAP
ncbi:MAG: TonB-dependent receptor, partial [Kamptonema sp. SIO4C4]|nr:TonB-dependent receptor [Kamptonema sp. SIO4C4]